MANKLIISNYKDHLVSAIFQERNIIQIDFEEEQESRLLGNIYVGKVQNIVKNINAAFVELAPGVMGYLSLGEVTNPIYTNHNSNSKKVNIGDELIVQVIKDAVKTKAPVVTTNINIIGKYVVLIHGSSHIGISAKIQNETKREVLRKMMEPFKQESYGFIVRTNAQEIEASCIEQEVMTLKRIYDEIIEYGVHKTRFTLLHRSQPTYICNIRDQLADSISEIVTDDVTIYNELKQYLELFQQEDLAKLRFYDDKLVSLSNLYGLTSKIENAIKPHVWLKSGGSLVIQPTEALTVIDVNTEKAIAGRKKVQDTFFKINMEAANEIAKQIRLRNISGIIIIDFIDLEDEVKKHQLMKELERLFKKDPVKTVLVDMTPLGLVEVTRKKTRRPLHEQIKKLNLI